MADILVGARSLEAKLSIPAAAGIRVMICGAHPLLGAGLRHVLDRADGIEVTVDVQDPRQAVGPASELQVDVILLDLLRYSIRDVASQAAVVGMIEGQEVGMVLEALQHGAFGVVRRDGPLEEIVLAVRAVAAGCMLIASSLGSVLAAQLQRDYPSRRPDARLDRLTSREREVFGLLAEGLSNSEIAAQLTLSDETVKYHVSRVFTKLSLRDRPQAIVFAYRSGVLPRLQPVGGYPDRAV